MTTYSIGVYGVTGNEISGGEFSDYEPAKAKLDEIRSTGLFASAALWRYDGDDVEEIDGWCADA